MNKYTLYTYFLTLLFTNIYCHNLELVAIKEPLYGPLTKNFLQTINNIFKIDTFVETGTFLGSTTKNAAQVFKKVHTIELSKDIFLKARKNLENFKNVTMHNGDSQDVLKKLLKPSLGKILFWLDGHYSGIHFGQQTAMGKSTTPLIQELEAIKNTRIIDSIIMIDDIRLFDKNLHNHEDKSISGYPEIKEVCEKIYEINSNYEILVMGDALFAFIKNPKIKISKALYACSKSMISENIDEIYDAEEKLKYANKNEIQVIQKLYNWFCQNSYFTDYGIGKYYALWYSIILLNNNNNNKAKEILKIINDKFVNKNRLIKYLQ